MFRKCEKKLSAVRCTTLYIKRDAMHRISMEKFHFLFFFRKKIRFDIISFRLSLHMYIPYQYHENWIMRLNWNKVLIRCLWILFCKILSGMWLFGTHNFCFVLPLFCLQKKKVQLINLLFYIHFISFICFILFYFDLIGFDLFFDLIF